MTQHLTSSLATLSTLDWCLLLFVFISTAAAFRRGLIRVIFSFLGLIVGILVASWNYLRFAIWLHAWVTSYPIAQVIAFVLLLFAVIIAASVIAGFFSKSLSALGLGFFDRLFGALFGFLRGAVLAGALVMALVSFVPGTPWLRQSRLAGYFLQAAHAISFVVPPHLQEQLAVGTTHLLQQSPKTD